MWLINRKHKGYFVILISSSLLVSSFQNCSGENGLRVPNSLASNDNTSASIIDSPSANASPAPSPSASPAQGGGNVMCSPLKSTTYASDPTLKINDLTISLIPNSGNYPAKGVAITDSYTGFKVTRVAQKTELTGDYVNFQNNHAAIVYSRFSPTNVTGEYVIVHGDNSTSAWVYRTSDSKMLFPLKFRPDLVNPSKGVTVDSIRSIGEVNEIRWDYSCAYPNRMYFVGMTLPSGNSLNGENVGMSFYYTEIDPSTGKQTKPVLVHDFSKEFPSFTTGQIMNDVEGDSSIDSRYWAWQVLDTQLTPRWLPLSIFVYDKTLNKVVSAIQRSCPAGASYPCKVVNTPSTTAPHLTRPNMVEMSPLGTRVIVDWERVYPGYDRDSEINTVSDGPKAFLKDFSDPIIIGSDATHSGWAWGPNGEEMFVSQNNRNDWIEAVDIANASTAKCSVISGNSYTCGVKIIYHGDIGWQGMHFGKIYDQNKKGLVYMNTYDQSFDHWAKNQNFLVKIQDASKLGYKVTRLGSTYNQYFDYRSEGSGALDFSGIHIWATANWGNITGAAEGDATKVALPNNIWK